VGRIRLGFIHDNRALLSAYKQKALLSSIRSDETHIFIGLDARVVTLGFIRNSWGSQNIRVRIWYFASPYTFVFGWVVESRFYAIHKGFG
jgi:hypothetical protein